MGSVPPQSHNKHSQTSKPQLQNGPEPKNPEGQEEQSPQASRGPQDPRTETTVIAEHKHLTHLHSETTRAPDPKSHSPNKKDPGFPSPMTHSPKQPRKRNPKAKPHPESPTMTPECIKSPTQDQETETS